MADEEIKEDGHTEELDVLGTALRLAQLIRNDSSSLDRVELERGEKLLTFFQDANFDPRFQGLSDFKTEVITQAIEDMADRAKVLSQSFIGVTFAKNALETFVCDYGDDPTGDVVYKISLRDFMDFQYWRAGQKSEVTAEDINAAIYCLTVEWSKLL